MYYWAVQAPPTVGEPEHHVVVYLIDGTYELFRAFFGAPLRKNREGREVGASRTLARSLSLLLERNAVTHAACAFDHVIESFRNDLFAGYKTGDGIAGELRSQFELAERVAAALGITVWPMVEFEADDAIATAAAELDRYPAVDQVRLCSPDKDLAQCVRGSRIVCWDRFADVVLDEAGVQAKFGVLPKSVPDYLALVGDRADGIPGISRWGAKASSTLLARYGSLENIPTDPERWDVAVRGRRQLASNLGERLSEALLYRTLATLRTDVPISVTPDALRCRGPEPDLMAQLVGELDDSRLAAAADEIGPTRRKRLR